MNCWLCGGRLISLEVELSKRDWTGQTITSPTCGYCMSGFTRDYGEYLYYCETERIESPPPFTGEQYRPECRPVAERAKALGVLKEFVLFSNLLEGAGIKIPPSKQEELAELLAKIKEDTEAAVAEAVRSNSI